MALTRTHRVWLQRVAAVLIVVVGVPFLVALGSFTGDALIREGEPSPRTVIADQRIRIIDADATEKARKTAAESVSPVEVFDDAAQAEIVSAVRDVFADVRSVREPVSAASRQQPAGSGPPTAAASPTVPGTQAQVRALRTRVPELSDAGLEALVGLSSTELARVESETVSIAQQLARQRITADDIEETVNQQLRVELALRSFPDDVRGFGGCTAGALDHEAHGQGRSGCDEGGP